MTNPRCKVCDDELWVCENHPNTPWRKRRKGVRGCECGAGMPCLACNEPSGERPRMPKDFIPSYDGDKGPVH